MMEATEDNRKLISASTPLEVYAALRRRERAGDIAPEDATSALAVLRMESARMVQQPLNPAVLDAARDMFQGTEIMFVSASGKLLEAAASEGFPVLDPAKDAFEAVKEAE